MKINELFQQKKLVVSFEVFPPKVTSPVETIYETLDALQDLQPDFISVTYSAGDKVPGGSTCDIAAAIKHKYHIEPLAHITCLNSSKEDIDRLLRRLQQEGVENKMCIRDRF